MQPSDFTEDRWGKLLRHREGFWYFVPDRLPPRLAPDWNLTGALSEADRSLSELAGLSRNVPNPHLLIGAFIRKEAVLSSRIEGTQASLSDLFLFEAGEAESPKPPDVREVANYVHALEFGLKRLTELPISLRLLREIHSRLMGGVRGEHLTPGEFRTSPNWIGPPGCTLLDATYVPPAPPEMTEALGDLEQYLHAASDLPPLVRLALIHYQFEAIHPFLDGNGRMGRLLISLLLCHERLLPQPLLYLSAFFERHRDQYYGALWEVSRSGRWHQWIALFLQAVASQSRDVIRRTGRLLDLRENYRRRFQQTRSSSLLLRLVDQLFESPYTTISLAARVLGVTRRPAALNIKKLVDSGILNEATGRERSKIYIAREILDTIERPNPD
jgi:Fic family protein